VQLSGKMDLKDQDLKTQYYIDPHDCRLATDAEMALGKHGGHGGHDGGVGGAGGDPAPIVKGDVVEFVDELRERRQGTVMYVYTSTGDMEVKDDAGETHVQVKRASVTMHARRSGGDGGGGDGGGGGGAGLDLAQVVKGDTVNFVDKLGERRQGTVVYVFSSNGDMEVKDDAGKSHFGIKPASVTMHTRGVAGGGGSSGGGNVVPAVREDAGRYNLGASGAGETAVGEFHVGDRVWTCPDHLKYICSAGTVTDVGAGAYMSVSAND
jgi:hypothetical protein